MNTYRPLLAALAAALVSPTLPAAEMPSAAEMWRIIQAQQKEIDALKSAQKETDQKAEAAVEAVETRSTTSSSSAAWAEKTRIGGYGELHYNNLDNQTAGGNDKDEIDLHRLILFLGHEFSDDIRFWSEIEYEHGNTEANGAVEIEQAYLEFDLNDQHRARAGMFLLPVGIMNETHEPTTFYGVERNPVENNIVPVTWWAGGASLLGELGNGFSYDVALHEGLNTSLADSYRVRSGRQSTSEAEAHDLAFTGRLKWTGMQGVELAATFQHQSDVTQGNDASAGSANLVEAHAILNRGPYTLKALYAQWDLDGNGPASIGADEQQGWYIEPSYKITPQLGLFARFNQWDNRAGDALDSEYQQLDVGVNYWPHPDVVIKADYQDQDVPNGADEFDGFNLGVGYQF